MEDSVFRPKIAVPGRFTESASALRYRGLVSARRLMEAIWLAGGDPVTLLPAEAPDGTDWAGRMAGFHGVLLPGGGDVTPSRYGMSNDNPSLYDMNEIQDETDFTLAAYALDNGIPLLAVCRGLHVVNALLGGTLVIDMDVNHRHHTHTVALSDEANHLGFGSSSVGASCYHHQAIDKVAERITVLGRAEDDTVEAIAIDAPAWAGGVQWHPEDIYDADPIQLKPFITLVEQARNGVGR
jgi:putative glutamine amidotransferase